MSRVGKNPVAVPAGVDITIAGGELKAKGKLGQLSVTLLPDVDVTMEDGSVTVKPANDSKRAHALWGTTRALVNNAVEGVSNGFKKELELVGVGYRAAVEGKELVLQLGFSHEIRFPIPEGIEMKCAKPTSVEISGTDKQVVGQVAAVLRGYRPPEPYKGKGVKYVDEYIFRKEGKKK